MGQAWDTRKKRAVVSQVSVAHFRASEYRHDELPELRDVGGQVIRAADGATWERYDPFSTYRPSSVTRDPEAGPHLAFLNLKGLTEPRGTWVRPQMTWASEEEMQKGHRPSAMSSPAAEFIVRFTNAHGLLGLFHEQYSPPVLDLGRTHIAPEAVIDDRGVLRSLDPASEGIEALKELLSRRGSVAGQERKWPFSDYESDLTAVALPREAFFLHKRWGNYDTQNPSGEGFAEGGIPWEEAAHEFGAVMVLDERSSMGVSVLCTQEPRSSWSWTLDNFPDLDEQEDRQALAAYLGDWLTGVSPDVRVGPGGRLERSWRCASLIRAMWLMLYLDLTGGNNIKQCASHDCNNYYRPGPQDSKYCSPLHAQRAAKRMQRGREP